MDDILPGLSLPEGAFDPRALKAGAAEVWLEIGFGGGEHLAAQAAARPDVLMIGAEPFLNGVASAVRHVHDQGLSNVRLSRRDARELVGALPDAALDRVFILFPDPWPKTRHHKRRLLQPAFVRELARAMRPGARLRAATDWKAYAAWSLEQVLADGDFLWTAQDAAAWRTPPADHVTTRYETKRLGDTGPIFLEFLRR
ncbi:MAG TPA: tRNA (guanosine(46)-N7)-methyltransferase TrmB [Rugosimonospora sp.]|nr:tRNA (guanosine(46)-N7)-methyltransferase TrmB [Rugosimonospora sp.]